MTALVFCYGMFHHPVYFLHFSHHFVCCQYDNPPWLILFDVNYWFSMANLFSFPYWVFSATQGNYLCWERSMALWTARLCAFWGGSGWFSPLSLLCCRSKNLLAISRRSQNLVCDSFLNIRKELFLL